MVTRFTLHTHERSASADSVTPARVMAQEYADRGFDVVGFVGHDERPSVPGDLPVETLTGIEREVRKRPTRVHVLDFPDHDLSVLAHPRLSHPQDTVTEMEATAETLGVDAVERFNRGVEQYGGYSPSLPETASDDAHNTSQVATSYMETDAPPTAEGVVQAVKDGNVQLVNEPAGRLRYARGRLLQGVGMASRRFGVRR